jgi:hypothetical protein
MLGAPSVFVRFGAGSSILSEMETLIEPSNRTDNGFHAPVVLREDPFVPPWSKLQIASSKMGWQSTIIKPI